MSDADDPEEPDDAERPVRDVVRVDGPETDDDADSDDQPPGRDGVMDPDDLDIRDRDGVDETDDGRYVISTAGGDEELPDPPRAGDPPPTHSPPNENADSDAASPGVTDPDAPAPDATDPDATDPETTDREARTEDAAAVDSLAEEDPLETVAAELTDLSASHGFALAVAAGGETDTLRVASGDPTDTLSTALRWYAGRVNPDEPPEETIAELLAASDLDVG